MLIAILLALIAVDRTMMKRSTGLASYSLAKGLILMGGVIQADFDRILPSS